MQRSTAKHWVESRIPAKERVEGLYEQGGSQDFDGKHTERADLGLWELMESGWNGQLGNQHRTKRGPLLLGKNHVVCFIVGPIAVGPEPVFDACIFRIFWVIVALMSMK